MKLGVISDLHVDDNPRASVLEALIKRAKQAGVDALVIPGDISSAWRESLSALEELEAGCGLPVFFVPGNHDLWNKKHPDETPEAAQASLVAHPGCLSGRRVDLGPWTLIGETGWYDESFAEGRFSPEEVMAMRYGDRTWHDSLYTRWAESMLEKNRYFLERLESALDGLDPSRTIVVTHMVPRLEFTVQPPAGIWTYFNALLGSASYGRLFARRGVRAALFGHVHYRRRATIDGVEWICSCLGTQDEWRKSSVDDEIAEAFAVLDLD
jgi:putative phosphoesterase